MMYQGIDIYKFYLGNQEVELSEYDICQIFLEYNEYNLHRSKQSNIFELHKPSRDKRKYNKKAKIKSLFLKYYDETKTKKEALTRISLELKLSFKAVEKAYYSKN